MTVSLSTEETEISQGLEMWVFHYSRFTFHISLYICHRFHTVYCLAFHTVNYTSDARKKSIHMRCMTCLLVCWGLYSIPSRQRTLHFQSKSSTVSNGGLVHLSSTSSPSATSQRCMLYEKLPFFWFVSPFAAQPLRCFWSTLWRKFYQHKQYILISVGEGKKCEKLKGKNNKRKVIVMRSWFNLKKH